MRFGVTFVASFGRAGLSFLTGVIVARALGAGGYGDLSFLLAGLTAVSQFLDAGTAPAFFTFVSERRQPKIFFAVYLCWKLGLQFIGVLVALALMPGQWIAAVWLGQPRGVVVIAFCASFAASQLWVFISQLGEASRRTLTAQAAVVGQATLQLLMVSVLWASGRLTVPAVLSLQFLGSVLMACLVGPSLIRSRLEQDETPPPVSQVARGFVRYSLPLLLSSIVVLVYSFADRWMLQSFGGAVQQGFFAVGQQFSVIGVLTTTAVVNVLWKEVAAARIEGNGQRMRVLYQRTCRAMFLIGAWTVSLVLPYSREVLSLTVGAGYTGGSWILALLLFYSVHQSIGQIQGTFFMAAGETAAYTIIGSLMVASSIPFSYLLLAPSTAAIPGMALGGAGIAIKMVVWQLVGVTVQSIWLRRRFGLPVDFIFQVVALSAALGASVSVRALASWAFASTGVAETPLRLIASGGAAFIAVTALAVAGAWRWNTAFREMVDRLFVMVRRLASPWAVGGHS